MNERACLAAAFLLPAVAYGSYGGGGPCRDFGCHFLFWGVLLAATWGMPVSGVVFAALHWFFCHAARSKSRQAMVGAVIGIVAYEIAAACAAYMANAGKNPWIGLFAASVVLAGASVLYARSSPGRAAPQAQHVE